MPYKDPEKKRQWELTHRFTRSKGKLARQNRRRRSSNEFIGKPVGDRIGGDRHTPTKDGNYTRGQTWGALHHAWMGFKIANNREGYLERLNWAIKIQNLQSDLEIQRSSFPQLGLLGDRIFLFDKTKEEELRYEEESTKEEYKEYRLQKRAHIKKIVHIGELTDMERACLPDFYSSDKVERVSLVDTG